MRAGQLTFLAGKLYPNGHWLYFPLALLVKTPQGLIVTDLGRLLIRNIAMRFDAYATTRKENRFSRTI
jgi:hypothetical protein